MTGSGYPPIPEYAFLSDCHTAALVGPDAAVEWMCAPRYDGPSVLARILDRRRGAWTIDVTDSDPPERHYVETSLVLRTQWNTPSGTIVADDFLARRTPKPPASAGSSPRGC